MLQADEMAQRLEDFELTTPRLRLRRLIPADEPFLIEHEMNPDIMASIRDPQPRAKVVEQVAGIFKPWQAAEESWVAFALEESATSDFIGMFFFRVISYENQSLELGYRLHPDYWRRGYATEAGQRLMEYLAEELETRKVVAYCVAENEGSARVLENLGFEREGCLKQHSFLGGKWCDELVYGRVFSTPETTDNRATP